MNVSTLMSQTRPRLEFPVERERIAQAAERNHPPRVLVGAWPDNAHHGVAADRAVRLRAADHVRLPA